MGTTKLLAVEFQGKP